MLEIQLHLLKQCSQPSGCPVGPCGGASKGPGLDRTATCSPRAVKARDGCPWAGRRALQGEFGVGDNGRWQGTAKGSKERQGTVEDCGGWLVTARVMSHDVQTIWSEVHDFNMG